MTTIYIIIGVILWLVIVPLMARLKNNYYNYEEPKSKEDYFKDKDL